MKKLLLILWCAMLGLVALAQFGPDRRTAFPTNTSPLSSDFLLISRPGGTQYNVPVGNISASGGGTVSNATAPLAIESGAVILNGVVNDTNIPSTIARDSEVLTATNNTAQTWDSEVGPIAVAAMATNNSLRLQTTNARVYAQGFEPTQGATYGPNIEFGGTNAMIVGTESHSSFVMGGRHGNGYQNIISNGLWCVINGGYGNRIIGDDESAGNSTISGGELNNMVGLFSVGGYNSFNTIGGGEIHAMGNPDGSTFMLNSTISGGRGNKITGTSGSYVFIGGGGDSTGGDNIGHVVHNGDFSFIPGGRDNKITNAIAGAIGWDLIVTNDYEIKLGYSNNAASVRSNGTVVAVNFAGGGNGITAINADNIETGTIPSALFNGIYDQDLFFTSLNNIFFADEMHVTDVELSSAAALNNAPTGNNGGLLNSNKVIHWVTATSTNPIALQGGSFTGNGSGLTNLQATNIVGTANYVLGFDSSGNGTNIQTTGSGMIVRSNSPTIDNMIVTTNSRIANLGITNSGGDLILRPTGVNNFRLDAGSSAYVQIRPAAATSGLFTFLGTDFYGLGGTETLGANNAWLRMSAKGITIKSNAISSWPTAPATAGDAFIGNSNGVVYLLTSVGSTWAATNKIAP